MFIKNDKGFTLIEIIAVLVIISVLAILVVPRLFSMNDNASIKMVEDAISRLNTHEKTFWLDQKMVDQYKNDLDLFNKIDYDLGADYEWVMKDQTSGVLRFQENDFLLNRTPSTKETFAVWELIE